MSIPPWDKLKQKQNHSHFKGSQILFTGEYVSKRLNNIPMNYKIDKQFVQFSEAAILVK